MAKHRIVPLRMDDAEIERLDRIVSRHDARNAGIRTTRSYVLRAILDLGTEALEKKLEAQEEEAAE